ncbi:MAG: hypothetical protein AcusKO_42690 [Acuticoccus sp.]
MAKGEGDEVVGGTTNKTGAFTFMAGKVGADTVLSQIIKMVEAAQGAKLPIQALVDKVTYVFVPIVISASPRLPSPFGSPSDRRRRSPSRSSTRLRSSSSPVRAQWGSRHLPRSWSAQAAARE